MGNKKTIPDYIKNRYLFPSKEDRVAFLDNLAIEHEQRSLTKKNLFKRNTNAFTVSILATDACVRQMEALQTSPQPSDREKFAELMSDKHDSLPLRITVPTFVYWMNPILGKKGYNYPVDHPKVVSKCKSFYTSGKGKYHGYFDKLFAANVLTKKEQVCASGALHEAGRKAIVLWISKDAILGTKYEMKPSIAPNCDTVSDIPTENSPALPTPTPLFLGITVGESYQNATIKNILTNIKNKETKESGEKKSSDCGKGENSVDDFFPTVLQPIASANIKKQLQEQPQAIKADETRPKPAIAPAENLDVAQILQKVPHIAENVTDIAEKITELYTSALEKGQVRGSKGVVFTAQTFPTWEWSRIKNETPNILQALHVEGETWFETRERTIKTLEIELNRLKNSDKFIYLPNMYLNTTRKTNGEWVMSNGSLVAFHDYLKHDKQLNDARPSASNDFTESYKVALGGATRILREIGINQAWIDEKVAIKGRKQVVKTVLYCIGQNEKGAIKGSLRAYMMKVVNDCGWTLKKVGEAIAKLKGEITEFKRFNTLDKAVRYEILTAIAWQANKNGLTTKAEVFAVALEAVSNLSMFIKKANA